MADVTVATIAGGASAASVFFQPWPIDSTVRR
jgi:hypothetical protein